MNFASWLDLERQQRDWLVADLAREAGVSSTIIRAVLNGESDPDFRFCYGVSQALNKQPERVLNIAGLLSDVGLKVALDVRRDPPPEDLRQRIHQLPIEDRRLIAACLAEEPTNPGAPNPLWIMPNEFTKQERTQDRFRFATMVLSLMMIVVILSVFVGWVLR